MKILFGIVCAVVFAIAPLAIVTAQTMRPCANAFSLSREFLRVLREGRSHTASEMTHTQQVLFTCLDAFQSWDTTFSAYERLPYVSDILERFLRRQYAQLRDVRTFFPYIRQFIRIYPNVVGTEGEKRYIILLQNNMELRPTGGFVGSFVYVVFRDGKLVEFRPEDIYAPDGQLKGYVKPPEAVEKYLYQKGGWKLRDANWDPDFSQAVQTLLWFFDKGGYRNIDGVVAITLTGVQEYMQILGPLYLPDYDKEIDAEGLYAFAQSQTEQGFFPGASNKRDVLGALSRAFTRNIESLTIDQVQRFGHTFLQHLASKDIQIWVKDKDLAELVQTRGWDGTLRTPICRTEKCRKDYLYVVEANVGINKANCCIDRTIAYDVWLNNDMTATSSLRIAYANHNPVTPQPPKFYGGGYNNYMRVLRDPLWKLRTILRDNVPIDFSHIQQEMYGEDKALSSGMLADVGGGESHEFMYMYEHELRYDFSQPQEYVLTIQKQPGLRTNEYSITIFVPQGVRIDHVSSSAYYINQERMLTIHTTIDQDFLLSFTVLRE